MSDEIVKINLGTKIVSLKITTFEGEVDPDDLLRIDYSNIIGEILTFPVLMNRIGLLRADQEELMVRSKMDFEIFVAQAQEEKRKSLVTTDIDDKGKSKTSKPTQSEVENAVLVDVRYKMKRNLFFQHQKYYSYLDSLYWAAKDKSDKLNRFSEKLRPEEFEKEILIDTINGILIKQHDKLIK